MQPFNYISLGYECSTATTLRDLGLRKAALPFDWIQASAKGISQCILENFTNFHRGLYLNEERARIIGEYGFQFVHDYPVNDDEKIVDSWKDYHKEINAKYIRRIARFHQILQSSEPIIALYRGGDFSDISLLKDAFLKRYGKTNIIYVFAPFLYNVNRPDDTLVPNVFEDVVVCDPDDGGKWNQKEIWLKAIERAKDLLMK